AQSITGEIDFDGVVRLLELLVPTELTHRVAERVGVPAVGPAAIIVPSAAHILCRSEPLLANHERFARATGEPPAGSFRVTGCEGFRSGIVHPKIAAYDHTPESAIRSAQRFLRCKVQARGVRSAPEFTSLAAPQIVIASLVLQILIERDVANLRTRGRGNHC